MSRYLLCSATVLVALMAAGQQASAAGLDERCQALADQMAGAWPEAGTTITASVAHEAGPMPAPPGPPGMRMPPVDLPAHCEITGSMHEREGMDGQHYAIRFHLRLPESWNGRLFFSGGGGTNGNLGDAVGLMMGSGMPPALVQGYAVLSQDSGHDNAVNTVPNRNGASAFGFDAEARADYGGTSLKPVTLAAKALISAFYGEKPQYSYFVGCSKGGQEGMVLAQRYPDLYDGIVAGAPGFSLPRAALAEVWDTQSFADVVRAKGEAVTLSSLAASFSESDMALVRDAVLEACDADDGLADGIVGAYAQCTSEKVVPALEKRACETDKADGCLSPDQIHALERTHQGVTNSEGKALYASFPWDAGWSDGGWRIWKIGSADGRIPSINVMMGVPSLAAIFTTPPTALGPSPQDYFDYALDFNFDKDAPAIYATGEGFPRSAWEDISARSDDLSAFREAGGKMIVPQGLSDPVFSIHDTIAWWNEVNGKMNGNAAQVVRLFPVPGMGHCSGGPATDGFDAFGALVDWVEQGEAPDRIEAKAGPASPWPGRSRPLCAYPAVARPTDSGGNTEVASAFTCSVE